jgi:ribosomal protein S16
VLTISITLLVARIGRGGRPFLLVVVLLSIIRRDSVSIVFRVGILRPSSVGRTIFEWEVQYTLLSYVVGKVVF